MSIIAPMPLHEEPVVQAVVGSHVVAFVGSQLIVDGVSFVPKSISDEVIRKFTVPPKPTFWEVLVENKKQIFGAIGAIATGAVVVIAAVPSLAVESPTFVKVALAFAGLVSTWAAHASSPDQTIPSATLSTAALKPETKEINS